MHVRKVAQNDIVIEMSTEEAKTLLPRLPDNDLYQQLKQALTPVPTCEINKWQPCGYKPCGVLAVEQMITACQQQHFETVQSCASHITLAKNGNLRCTLCKSLLGAITTSVFVATKTLKN